MGKGNAAVIGALYYFLLRNSVNSIYSLACVIGINYRIIDSFNSFVYWAGDKSYFKYYEIAGF